jgi:hypothetical protein
MLWGPKDGGVTFVRNAWLSPKYTALHVLPLRATFLEMIASPAFTFANVIGGRRGALAGQANREAQAAPPTGALRSALDIPVRGFQIGRRGTRTRSLCDGTKGRPNFCSPQKIILREICYTFCI